MDSVAVLLDRITETLQEDRAALRRLKSRIAATEGAPLIRNDALLNRYRADVAAGLRETNARLERILTLNKIRSQSGIATITVITEPYPCPGRCVYCPTEAHAPKSYLTNEPAVRRAVRNDYDPFQQMRSRIEALQETGHPTDKIELIIKGGTWSFYPDSYQREFIQRCLDAANGMPSLSLRMAQQLNEVTDNRVIGVTIETRPDYVTPQEISRLLELGVTRVEIGVQTLEDAVLDLIVRDHGTAAVRQATKWLKDAGFKVAYHLMPNLPGATPDTDLETMRQLFAGPDYQPDTLKLYPCVVVETAELYQWWREGRYTPYDDETLAELLCRMKLLVPPHVRIERIIRDIPSTSIRAGCMLTNLREEVQRRLRARGAACRCIRCRQVRDDARGEFRLMRRDYEASGGRELFLSFEDASTDRLAALLRLRIMGGHGMVRELHTYGQHLRLRRHSEEAAQHQGFGHRLLEEAERIARDEFRCARMLVIAGVGVRAYYRKFGYELSDTYMAKALA